MALQPLFPGIVLLVFFIVGIGLFPGILYSVTEAAAQQMYDPQVYISAVLDY